MQFFILTAATRSCPGHKILGEIRIKKCICEVGELKVGLFSLAWLSRCWARDLVLNRKVLQNLLVLVSVVGKVE